MANTVGRLLGSDPSNCLIYQGEVAQKGVVKELRTRFFDLEKSFLRKTMLRANRYFLPGYIWHITHRCPGKFVPIVPVVPIVQSLRFVQSVSA